MTDTVKRCKVCGKDWPATTEFYSVDRFNGRLMSPKCKRCLNKAARERLVASGHVPGTARPGRVASPTFNQHWTPRKPGEVEIRPRLVRFTPPPEWMSKPLLPPVRKKEAS